MRISKIDRGVGSEKIRAYDGRTVAIYQLDEPASRANYYCFYWSYILIFLLPLTCSV